MSKRENCIFSAEWYTFTLHVLQFERESGFTEKTAKTDEDAVNFKVRRIFWDFNATQIALLERYRKNTRVSDIVGMSTSINGL